MREDFVQISMLAPHANDFEIFGKDRNRIENVEKVGARPREKWKETK